MPRPIVKPFNAWPGILSLVLLLLPAVPSFGQIPTPFGLPFLVNSFTPGDQWQQSVAMNASGDFVVVWHSYGSAYVDTSGYSIQGQRFDSNGSPLGGQFEVNSYTSSNQGYPTVAVDAVGDFVVVWQSYGSVYGDSSNFSIQAQRFDSNGSPISEQFEVNSYTTGAQTNPSLTMEASGDFVVVWQSYGSSHGDTSGFSVQGQRFDSNGSLLGGQFQVNSYTSSTQSYPTVAVDAVGNFVVVWQSYGSVYGDNSNFSIQGQRFDSNGSLLGGQFEVNSYITGGQNRASVAVNAVGDFVVVWDSNGSAGSDTALYSVQGQRFDSNGSSLGGQFQVNTDTFNNQNGVSLAMDTAGDFVVVWQSFTLNPVSLFDIRGQRYVSTGHSLGGEFLINSFTTGLQKFPTVAADAVGDFVVAWVSFAVGSTDTSLYGVQGQRFGVTSDVGDLVFFDQNLDGLQDPSEPGVAGVTVNVFGESGGFVASTTTDADGKFLVQPDLGVASRFYLEFQPPPGYLFTVADAGSDDSIDSDADEVTGQTGIIESLSAGEIFLDFDAGLVLAPLVGDRVWLDDGDGLQAGGEPGVQNVTVHLYSTSGVLQDTTTTDANGDYAFSTLPGDYYLEFVLPAGMTFAPRDQGNDDATDSDVFAATGTTTFFSLAVNQVDASRDAGLEIDTDADGVADRIDNCPSDSNPGQVDSDGDGTGDPCDLCLGDDASGDSDADGVCDASDVCPGFDDSLDADSDGVPDGCDQCQGDDASGDVDGDLICADLDCDDNDATNACTITSVGDRVWLDANLNGLQDGGEVGFAGVTVELFTQAGVSQGTVLTLVDGSYSFTGLSAGTYYLAFSEPPGHCYTAQDQGNDDGLDSDVNPVTFTTAPFVLVDGQSDVSRDGGLVPDASIGNRVWLDDGDGLQAGGEPGIANVTVNLYDAGKVLLDTTTTDAGGFYTFAPGPGDYYLEFVLPAAMVFAPRDVGDDDLVDSDVFAASGTTVIFNLGSGQVDASRDAGLELDGDGDGIADRLDNCPADANPGQTDSDGDGSGDVCDLCQGNDATGDSDADGVCDDTDICPGFDDALDADGDGIPDGCDQCQGNDASGDSDADGVCDDTDICAGFDDGLDADGDSVPDGCDFCPGFDDALDADGDGVPDGCDQCQGNDASGDSDADGVCDDLDICAGFDDGLDADQDGVPDGCDVCQGDDATGDADDDLICADLDCNDNDATNACAVFSDGFETADTSSWSSTTTP